MTAEILAKVEYSNLLSISWNEQKIQTNFRLLVDALSQQQAGDSELRSDIQRLKEEVTKLSGRIDGIPKHHCTDSKDQPSSRSIKQGQQEGQSSLPPNLLNELQKKLSDNHSQLFGDITDLRKELERLRAELRESMAAKESDTKLLPLAEVPAYKPPVESHQSCLSKQEASKKFDAIFDMLDKMRADNHSIQAKLSVQQQTLDSHRKSLSQVAFQTPQPPKTITMKPTTTNLPAANESQKRLDNEPQVRRESIKPTKANPSAKEISNQQNQVHHSHEEFVPLAAYQQDRENLDSQLGNVLIDMSTLKLCYDQLKLVLGSVKKSEQRQDDTLQQLSNRQEAMRQRMDIQRDRVDRELKNLKLTIAQLTAFEKELEKKEGKESQEPPVPDNTAKQTEPEPVKQPESKAAGSTSNRRDSDANRIASKLSTLQSLMVEAANRTDLDRLKEELFEQIKSLKTSTDKKLNELSKGIDESHSLLESLDERVKGEIKVLQTTLEEQGTTTKTKFAEGDKKHNILNSIIEELRKDIQYLKEDLQYYKNTLTKDSGSGNSNSVYAKIDDDGGKTDKSALDALRKKTDEMKRQYTNKLHDLRSELMNAIRDFQRKMSNRSNVEQELGVFQDKLEELRLYLSRKADVEDTKKSLIYLDKKLSVLMSSLNRDESTVEDARAAKKNWFCLSCDKVLEGYSGKVGKHIPWDALSPKQTSKAAFLHNTSKIEDKKRKDSLPTLSTSIKK